MGEEECGAVGEEGGAEEAGGVGMGGEVVLGEADEREGEVDSEDVAAAIGEAVEGEERGEAGPGEEVPPGDVRASLRWPKEILLVFPNTYSFISQRER